MKHLSLFSGIGGIDIAAEWAGFSTVAFCEIDKYCQQVLKKHWPDVPIIEDVKDVTKESISKIVTNAKHLGWTQGTGERIQPQKSQADGQDIGNLCTESTVGITLISGGFPCQPHSVAGRHKGSGDERDLWPEFRRVIGEIRPRWVLGENVPGIFTSDSRWFFGKILADLAEMGYSVGWCTFGAVDVGALHRRNRVFIVAHAGLFRQEKCQEQATGVEQCSQAISDSNESRPQGHGRLCECAREQTIGQSSTSVSRTRESQSRLGRMVDGLSYWLDEPQGIPRVAVGVKHRVDRLKCLGNAVVPQQVYPILKVIADYERGL